ncbi:DsbA family protein [Jeotgalibaca porci]|uniref:DsbA family protein n=3 Tax=Jeotgalibaca porci TaxID=1868793 RepID=A0A6G7WIF2_9LACT|nr:DsbA family protein [Jeotgalibaca porci]QIK52016.1 DsbA family protein [Jeotgalibaca porci]
MSKIEMYYATDPLCSFCWAFEPTLRKFRYQYASYISNDTTVMGGMIEKWEKFGGDSSNGIQSAADVAKHWREIGDFSRMVIDGRVWLDEPIDSSFPSSQAFQIVRRDYPEQAQAFLRKLRETVMVWNQDISKREVLAGILEEMGLDHEKILNDADSFEGRSLLNSDLGLARALTATGFPTLVLVNEQNQGVKVVGAQPYEALESALKQILGVEELIQTPVPSLDLVMKTTPFLMNREIEVLYNLEESEVPGFVDMIVGKENVQKGEVLGQDYYRRLTV